MAFLVREVLPEEVEAASLLAQKVFNRFIAPGCPSAGIASFRSFAQPGAVRSRLADGSFMLGAYFGEQIGGVLEMRDYSHISLLFTAEEYQRQGVARELFQAALTRCRDCGAVLREVTVNSSPFAVQVYRKLGFLPQAEEQAKGGIRYVPMALKL
ncbi:MAG TPA: GNAT family N-acetyltransferase [Selenomonadales bacterium]|nr:GNAT family N-acetyltransferase [Selenomonadales bacterium]